MSLPKTTVSETNGYKADRSEEIIHELCEPQSHRANLAALYIAWLEHGDREGGDFDASIMATFNSIDRALRLVNSLMEERRVK